MIRNSKCNKSSN